MKRKKYREWRKIDKALQWKWEQDQKKKEDAPGGLYAAEGR